ncbi:MAG TPA: YajQ family cyclic di-GMP-binding protein [Candidatus Saccharibacteria bacterium]|nr:YajQ family cyclic di-GMP-binding protein [Candidatus Saccharibacteria bacterium]
MATFSFDIVSEYNKAEMNNVFAAVEKEIASRYDFKGTPAAIEWLGDKTGFKITGAGAWQLDTITDIIRKKLVARGESSKSLDLTKEVVESNLKAAQEIPFKQGLDQDDAKKITKLLREELPKVKTQIQGDLVRATSGSKDDLQAAMRLLDAQDYDFVLKYTNYR